MMTTAEIQKELKEEYGIDCRTFNYYIVEVDWIQDIKNFLCKYIFKKRFLFSVLFFIVWLYCLFEFVILWRE